MRRYVVHNRAISGSPEIRSEPPQTVEVVVSVPTVVKAVGIFFALILVYLVRDALLSIALSAVFILGLDPPVSALERRGWGRGRAALLVFAIIALVVFTIIVWAVEAGVGRDRRLRRRSPRLHRQGAAQRRADEDPRFWAVP